MNLLSSDFEFMTLCKGINDAPVSLGPVSNSGLFKDQPCQSTKIGIEQVDNVLTLIRASLRGGIGDMHPSTGRTLIQLTAPHLRTSSTMLADSWQDRTGFNQQGAPANVLQEKDRIQAEHRMRIEATIDFQKTRALAGQILDADGSVMIDLLAEFGVVQQTIDCGLDTPTTNVANMIIAARRLSEAALGMAAAGSWIAFADAQFIDALRAHASVEAAVAGWQAASVLSADHRDGALVVGGVKFIEVSNRAGKTYIDAGTALLCPEGVPDLFVTNFAPADYIEATNMEALPLYCKAHELAFGRGLVLESQANPLSLCTRPRAVIKLTA